MNLSEKWRPRHLADLCGQPQAVAVLTAFAAKPSPCAFLLEGETGTGKTSAAFALARHLGCEVDQAEFGGVHEIASGEQTADSIRDKLRALNFRPFFGNGWKVLIVNECDRMSAQAETVWLDALERLPMYSVIVFTTNAPEKLATRFRDRCRRIEFVSEWTQLKSAAQAYAREVWRAETGQDGNPPLGAGIILDGHFSFRRMMNDLASAIDERSSATLFAGVA